MHVQDGINMQGEFFLKINKRACTSIRYTRVHSKSLYRRRRPFYWTENEIWAGFGLVGNTEKIGLFRAGFFMFSRAIYFFFLKVT